MTKTPTKKPAAKKAPAKTGAAPVDLLANVADLVSAGNGKHRVPIIMADGTVKYCALQPNGQIDVTDCI